MATLTKSGSSFALGDLRSYDAWGNVLGTNATGRPRGRYVASLGHVQDDESSLIYMRARYYEPGSGRFVSQDPANQGANWFSYCGNNPVNRYDASGKFWWFFAGAALIGAIVGVIGYMYYQAGSGGEITPWGIAGSAVAGAIAGLGAAATAGTLSAAAAGLVLMDALVVGSGAACIGGLVGGLTERGVKSAYEFFNSPVGRVVRDAIGYQFLLSFELASMEAE